MLEDAVGFLLRPGTVWAIVSLIGAWYAGLGSIEAWRDLQVMKGYGNGRRLNARRDVRNQVGRLVIAVVWFIIGALYVATGLAATWTLGSLALVATNILLADLSRRDLRDRQALMARVA